MAAAAAELALASATRRATAIAAIGLPEIRPLMRPRTFRPTTVSPTARATSTGIGPIGSSGRLAKVSRTGVFRSALLYHMALLDHKRGWAQQFHLGIERQLSYFIQLITGNCPEVKWPTGGLRGPNFPIG